MAKVWIRPNDVTQWNLDLAFMYSGKSHI
jgi:hypothetical protein